MRDIPDHGYDRNASHNVNEYVCDCGHKDCNDADLEWMKDAEKQIEFLKGELKSLSTFNPDWDVLQATRENLLEAYRDLTRIEDAMRAIQATTANPDVLRITDEALAGTFGDDERTTKGTH